MAGARFAHYEILERIGEGGMGVVFRARDTLLGRPVAIKMLATLLGSTPESRRLLLREARAAAALNHPNIATVYEVGEAELDTPGILEPENGDLDRGPVPYIAMEYVEGEDLRSRLRRGRLSLDDVARIGLQIAHGMEAAHRAKIVHRDLKPGNVIVDVDGHVKLLDFGLAKFLRDGALSDETQVLGDSLVTHDGVILGTVPYMAPEQLEGLHVDERSDLFSLGVLLYEMAAGQPPFQARAPVEYYKKLSERVEPLSAVEPMAPPDLSRVVQKLLARAPDERFQHAREVAAELRNLVREDREEPSREVAPTLSIGPPNRRGRRWLHGAVAVSAIVLILVAADLLLRRSPERIPLHLTVRPFDNSTGDVNEDDIALGVSKVLAAQLRRVHGLSADVAETADPPLLRGTVQRRAGRFEVDIELVPAYGEGSPWRERYGFASEEILDFQTELARDVVRRLGLRLTWRERRQLGRAPSRSVQAFQYYLQALSFLEDPTPPRLRKARERLERALELDDRFALALAALSEVLWETYARTGANDESLLKEAESAARRADRLEVFSPEAQIALARIYRAGGEPPRAIALLREAIRRHPRADEAHRELAITYSQDGQLCDAWRNARRAIELDKSFWHNWFVYGNVSARLGDDEMAREAFRRAAELAPGSEERPRRNLVAMHVEMGDYQDAIDSSMSLLRPVTHAYLASNLGTAYFFTGRLDEAETYFELAINLTEDPFRLSVIRQNLGDVWVRQGRREEAVAEYLRALELVESLEERPSERDLASLHHALLLAKVDQCHTAAGAATEIRLHLPDSSEKFEMLAKLHALCHEPERALGALEKAIQWGARGRVLAQWDEFASLAGTDEFQRITALDPPVQRCAD